jgi:hypothetical protein
MNPRINDTEEFAPATNAGGYAASYMRKYLVNVGGSGGPFLTGLINAGVPDAVLWAPKRYVATGAYQVGVSAGLIEDKLWLPTEREMFGSNTYSNAAYETETNQARLAYYTSDATRIKFQAHYSNDQQGLFFLASPTSGTIDYYFCSVSAAGAALFGNANTSRGVAPAFCVK